MGIKQALKPIYHSVMRSNSWTRMFFETRDTQTPVRFKMWFIQKILGFNRSVPWPVHFTSRVVCPNNINAGVETCPGYMPGCYIQADNGITIGDYTQIAPSVGIISANHDVHDNRRHLKSEPIVIGKYGWIGMGAKILPGVRLGDFTIVGAGAVVTKSFPEGYCVLGGSPAKVMKLLDKEKCVRHKSSYEYIGFKPK